MWWALLSRNPICLIQSSLFLKEVKEWSKMGSKLASLVEINSLRSWTIVLFVKVLSSTTVLYFQPACWINFHFYFLFTSKLIKPCPFLGDRAFHCMVGNEIYSSVFSASGSATGSSALGSSALGSAAFLVVFLAFGLASVFSSVILAFSSARASRSPSVVLAAWF